MTNAVSLRVSQKLLRVLWGQDSLHRQLQVQRLPQPRRRLGRQEGGASDVNDVDGDVISHDGGSWSTSPEYSEPQGEADALYREWGIQAAWGQQVS